MNKSKIILDLCGGTGSWSAPYRENGYDVRVITLPEYDLLERTILDRNTSGGGYYVLEERRNDGNGKGAGGLRHTRRPDVYYVLSCEDYRKNAPRLNGGYGARVPLSRNHLAIGFNHNSSVEGSGRIHFQLGKTALSGGTDVALCDSKYNSSVSATGYFSMNSSNTNSGGWSSSQMRTKICGTSLSSYSGTIIAVIPAALRAVLKSVTKYTDNTGNSSAASAVTATTDYFFLLSEYEVFGSISYGNSNESSKQKQYDYYSAGNSKIKYRHDATSTAVIWWLRSPCASGSGTFVVVYAGGTVTNGSAYYSYGFAPGFCV